ncbi:hypothetical protein OAC45_04020 [Gammaproteobacteria bacterium]|nr:hypothetical protein [Gammaproteobacteria bacterium]|tara:strand:- start:65 stop:367 length:303 start_codon:yes stop_codon:yes gene_type:complete
MKKITLLLSLTLSGYMVSETVKGYEIDPINCISALSIGRDAASDTGNNQLLSMLTNVQNNIYNLLPDFPKYSLIQSKKRSMKSLGTGSTEIMLSCVEKYQ